MTGRDNPNRRIESGAIDVLLLHGGGATPELEELLDRHFGPIQESALPERSDAIVQIGNRGRYRVAIAVVDSGRSARLMTSAAGTAGARLVVQLGSCRPVQSSVQPGDLVLPSAIVMGDSETRGAVPDGTRLKVTGDLQRRAAVQIRPCWPYHTGVIYTTARMANASADELSLWQSEGFAAVDRESAYTFVAAEDIGIARLAIRYAAGETESSNGIKAMYDVAARVLDHLPAEVLDIDVDNSPGRGDG
jgi:nucleoside phosphorylase